MRFALVWVAVAALSGCQKGDGLVVVTVSASSSIHAISALNATASIANGASKSFAIPTGGAPFDIPPAKTFGIDIPASMSGTFALHLEARDATGALIAQGDGMADVSAGSRVDLPLDLAAAIATVDGGLDAAPDAGIPDAATDGAVDLAPACDGGTALACGPSCTACPVPTNGVATCNGTACDIQCNTNYHACSGACVSNSDVASCGPSSCTPCTVPTGGTATCDGTSCGGSCPSGTQLCLGACIANGMACSGMCPSGEHNCSGLCDSNTSVNSCGAMCGSCPAVVSGTATCNGTACGYTCNTGTHDCGSGNCASNTSVSTCGTSCSPCPSAPANAMETCDGTSCGFACVGAFHKCGTACADNTSLNSCGTTSCTPCPAAPTNGTETCDGTKCAFTCATGYVPSGTTCSACGGLGQACCSAGTCNPGMTCATNTCGSHWDVIGTSDNTTGQFVSVWGSGANDVYLVDSVGKIYHSAGSGANFLYENALPSGTSGTSATAIWGSGSGDIYITGNVNNGGTITGSVWHDTAGATGSWPVLFASTSDYLYSAWGSGPTSVYFGGTSSAVYAQILHYNGSATSEETPMPFCYNCIVESIWGTAETNIFAVGTDQFIHHYDGSNWAAQSPPLGTQLQYGVWGSGPNNVYVVGAPNTMGGSFPITHYNGSTWNVVSVDSSISGVTFHGVWGSGENDIYAVGQTAIAHYDGVTWSSLPIPTAAGTNYPIAVWGSATNDVYVVGSGGLILHHP